MEEAYNGNVIQAINQYINQNNVNNGDMETITNNLLNELNNFIDRVKIRKYINVKIDMILLDTHPNPEQTDFTDDYINNLNNDFNEINQYVFQPSELNLINNFLDLINRCNREQKKIVYNRINQNIKNIPKNINIII
jgi:hypothetical protein